MKYVAVEEEVIIPDDVTISIDAKKVFTLKGPKGEIVRDFSHARFIDMKLSEDKKKVLFHMDFPRQKHIALVNTLKNLDMNYL